MEKITVEKLQAALQKDGTLVTLEEAAMILDFLNCLAEIYLEQV